MNVTIAAAALLGDDIDAGADVVVRFPDGIAADERRYSVWRTNPSAGTLDICVVQHGLGPGSRWAAACASGDAIEIARSRALPIALDHSADSHLLFGDETSIAGAEALVSALPREAVVLGGFEVDSPARRWPASELARPHAVQWIARAGRPGAALLAWLRRQDLSPAPGTSAYITGEAWLCAALHAHLVRERGFCPSAIRVMPYWKQRYATAC